MMLITDANFLSLVARVTSCVSFASQTLYLTAMRRKGLVSFMGQFRFPGIHLRFAVISENITRNVLGKHKWRAS